MLDKEPRREEKISAQTAYLMTSMMEGVVERGTGRGVRSLNRPVAGKTGTTNEQRDGWFLGYVPDLVSGVWVGFDDDRTLGASGTGGKVAAPIWLDFMLRALEGKPVTDFEMPEDIGCVNIDPETGLRARDTELDSVLECFKVGTEPVEFSPEWKVDPDEGSESLTIEEIVTPIDPELIEKYRSGQIFQ
jgi:penicillin-binding protein 1A